MDEVSDEHSQQAAASSFIQPNIQSIKLPCEEDSRYGLYGYDGDTSPSDDTIQFTNYIGESIDCLISSRERAIFQMRTSVIWPW